ncbi:hypothetical protein DP113_06860 [Brasilonema octagenarum UFV-E1]|jgi:hypothetical protein|uniref:Uncharacterized protein n=2 Tax=Brasilonema TaxID=383614 RepID=A0A856MA85_9CYAN|nr:hypothetical protein [Brasilonema octagenarum]NMF61924.1 hypothetical protein [Brasilonema octagenarum UFV-OR1]QDL07658.1 hypothetical protein DP114_06900 [Brasilonema sennae CENA114]QDL14020.1 hypothetical protein DP113_06860 [Brasilonema octagenarum UFV-E1]
MFATLIVSWIVYTVLRNVVRTTVRTAFISATTVVILHAGLGISPQDIWHQIIQLLQGFSQVLRVR